MKKTLLTVIVAAFVLEVIVATIFFHLYDSPAILGFQILHALVTAPILAWAISKIAKGLNVILFYLISAC
ncbi:MAG: hypothetical protein WEA61_10635 [Anaerolineales bacterium]